MNRWLRLGGDERGSALVLSVLLLAVISVLALSLISLGMTEFAIATNWRDYSTAFYGADAGVEAGVQNLKVLLMNTPQPTAADLAAIGPPTLNNQNLSFNAYSVGFVLPAAPYSYLTTMPTSSPYPGLNGLTTDYQIRAVVSGPMGTTSDLTQVYQYILVPLFQFGVFYGRGVDLEIAPGANMTFNGRIHANSDIYVGANGSTLSFDSYITTAGSVYRRIKRDPSIPFGNNPRIKDSAGTYQDLNFDHDRGVGFGSPWAETAWTAQAKSTFGPGGTDSTVKDKTMGVTEIVPPLPDLFYNPASPDVVSHQLIELPNAADSAKLAAAKMYSKAGLRIVDGVATSSSGSVALPPGALTTKTFWDGREGRNITVTEVNVGLVISSGAAPSNGVLYVGSTAGNSVRLTNGATLPSQGLTVVSPNPVYVQGDYNITNVGSTHPPAAVLADAITVLSNNWSGNSSDSKGSGAVGTRPASTTTVNAAFALGPNSESTSGNGNGQLENVIRFLEDWSGRTLTYNGSIVSLWHSQQATGAWRNPGAYYNAPIRTWAYDPLFNTTPPPGTPSGVVMTKGRWVQR